MSKSRHNPGPAVTIDSEVVRRIRQHARSSSKTEVCGVLIGDDKGNTVDVQACIAGLNAAQAGTHVTFTQDTWEHIYKTKDKEYPNDRIVGWYHSHPGFGVFLSDHDTFIHKNFFSSPLQVAWVYDPHSDEEGCFGWVNGRIERLSGIAVGDKRGGEEAGESGKPEPTGALSEEDLEEDSSIRLESGEIPPPPAWARWTITVLSHLSVLAVGFLACWVLFPREVPIPINPYTGEPLLRLAVPEELKSRFEALYAIPARTSTAVGQEQKPQSPPPSPGNEKEGHAPQQ